MRPGLFLCKWLRPNSTVGQGHAQDHAVLYLVFKTRLMLEVWDPTLPGGQGHVTLFGQSWAKVGIVDGQNNGFWPRTYHYRWPRPCSFCWLMLVMLLFVAMAKRLMLAKTVVLCRWPTPASRLPLANPRRCFARVNLKYATLKNHAKNMNLGCVLRFVSYWLCSRYFPRSC